jgi:hypothetical protein
MTVYSGNDRKCPTPSLTATQTTATGLAARNEHVRHELYMDNFFLSRALFDLHTTKTNCWGTVRPNRKGTLKNFGHKMKLKRGDPKPKVKSNFTVVIWKDKWNTSILMNMHYPPLEGNFCVKQGEAVKPAIIHDYNRHMGKVDKSDCMMIFYSISRQTWIWTKKLFLHILDLTILNFFIIFTACGSKFSLLQSFMCIQANYTTIIKHTCNYKRRKF